MSKLSIIISKEYREAVSAKSFWITTFVLPIGLAVFGAFIGWLLADNEVANKAATPAADTDDISGLQIAGMIVGMVMTLFILLNGASIFNKVKSEKCSRVSEILATCVPGRTLMMGKIISVGLTGLTQLGAWLVLGIAAFSVITVAIGEGPSLSALGDPMIYVGAVVSLLYFVGGYIFYGALFATIGATSDKNNENQEYVTVLTFLLMMAFYLGQYAAQHPDSLLTISCAIVPFTSPTIGTTCFVAGDAGWWLPIVSLVVLFSSAWGMVAVAGKMYTSALLLRGKRLAPKDFIAIWKMQ